MDELIGNYLFIDFDECFKENLFPNNLYFINEIVIIFIHEY